MESPFTLRHPHSLRSAAPRSPPPPPRGRTALPRQRRPACARSFTCFRIHDLMEHGAALHEHGAVPGGLCIRPPGTIMRGSTVSRLSSRTRACKSLSEPRNCLSIFRISTLCATHDALCEGLSFAMPCRYYAAGRSSPRRHARSLRHSLMRGQGVCIGDRGEPCAVRSIPIARRVKNISDGYQ
jgi:hypothetical protein